MAKVENPNERVLGNNNLIVTSYLDPITYNTTFSIIPAYDSVNDMYGYSRYLNVGTMIKDIDLVYEWYDPSEDKIYSENTLISAWKFSSDKSKYKADVDGDFYHICDVVKNSTLYAYNINNTAHYAIFTIDYALELKEDHGLIDDIIASATSNSPYQIDIGWSFSSLVDKSYVKAADAFTALDEITEDIVEISKTNIISTINIDDNTVSDQYRLYDNKIAIGESYYILFKKPNLGDYKTLRITNVPETLNAINATEYVTGSNEYPNILYSPRYSGTIDIDLAYFKDNGGFKNNPVCMILIQTDGWFDESFNKSNLIFIFIK